MRLIPVVAGVARRHGPVWPVSRARSSVSNVSSTRARWSPATASGRSPASTRLADHLHDGRALLLDLTAAPALRARAEGFGDRLRVVTAGCAGRPELAGLLVRPDGHVAWAAGRDGLPGALAPLDAALARWLGTPAPAPVLSDR